MIKPDGLDLGLDVKVKRYLESYGMLVKDEITTILTEQELADLYPKHSPKNHPITFAFKCHYLVGKKVVFFVVSGTNAVAITLRMRAIMRSKYRLNDFANVLHVPKEEEVEANRSFVSDLVACRAGQVYEREHASGWSASARAYYLSLAKELWDAGCGSIVDFVMVSSGTLIRSTIRPCSPTLEIMEDLLPSLDHRARAFSEVFPASSLAFSVWLGIAATTGKLRVGIESEEELLWTRNALIERGLNVRVMNLRSSSNAYL